MKISILTLFPKMISSFFEESIVRRAQEKGIVEISIVDLREFSSDSYKTVDNKPYGGGVGMVMKVDVISKALSAAADPAAPQPLKSSIDSPSDFGDLRVAPPTAAVKIIYTSPKGKPFTQKKAQEYTKLEHLIILAGHYEGVDERVMDFVDEEISLGDFVMTGGEIAAGAICDAVTRLLPGVLKKEEATMVESFYEIEVEKLIKVVGERPELAKLIEKNIKTVQLLEYPQYTRPEEFQGERVPTVLLSGNHAEIEKWQITQAFEQTRKKRPDLLEK